MIKFLIFKKDKYNKYDVFVIIVNKKYDMNNLLFLADLWDYYFLEKKILLRFYTDIKTKNPNLMTRQSSETSNMLYNHLHNQVKNMKFIYFAKLFFFSCSLICSLVRSSQLQILLIKLEINVRQNATGSNYFTTCHSLSFLDSYYKWDLCT